MPEEIKEQKEVAEEIKEQKEVVKKIKAKCSEKSCHRRLWISSINGVYCKNGHTVATPLIYEHEKIGNGPRRRHKKTGSTPK